MSLDYGARDFLPLVRGKKASFLDGLCHHFAFAKTKSLPATRLARSISHDHKPCDKKIGHPFGCPLSYGARDFMLPAATKNQVCFRKLALSKAKALREFSHRIFVAIKR